MNVASLELCKELYELSGWKQDSGYSWFGNVLQSDVDDRDAPAYSLGYLLLKLPGHIALTSTTWDDIHTEKNEGQALDYQAVACYQSNIKRLLVQETADTPEDATAKLAIELFKRGVLEKAS